MRERLAYLFMITILAMLIALTLGALGKGHYQPPENEQDKATLEASEGLAEAQSVSIGDSGSRSTAIS